MRGAQKPLEGNRARKEVMAGGKRWSGDGTKKEGRDRGRVKGCNKGNRCNELVGQKQDGRFRALSLSR